MVHKTATQPKILQKIDEGDASKLRVGNTISVSVAMFALRINDKGTAEMLLIKEYSTFNYDSAWKSPAGKMLPNENWVETVKRKFPLETGLTADSAKFCFGAEFSSTRKEKHYKVSVLIANFSGELSSDTNSKISERSWMPIGEAEKKINMAQQYALPYVIEAAKTLNKEFAIALMNSY